MLRPQVGEIVQTTSVALTSVSGKISYSWTIKDFRRLDWRVGQCYRSEFVQPEDKRLGKDWYITVFPGGEELDDRIGLHLNALEAPSEGIEFKPIVFRLFCDSKELGRLKFKITPVKPTHDSDQLARSNTILDIRDGFQRPNNQLLCTKDTLKVILEVTYEFTGSKDEIGSLDLDQASSPKLVRDFRTLLMNSESSDVSICVHGADIPAHRLILSARSKVFAAMFGHNTAERNTGRLDIDDFEYSVVKSFLEYIYCGKIDGMTAEMALQLMRAADKYDVPDLKERCSDFLASNVDQDNAIRFLIAAEVFGDSNLKRKIIHYIWKNYSSIDFKKHRPLIKHRPNVLCDVMEAIQEYDSEET